MGAILSARRVWTSQRRSARRIADPQQQLSRALPAAVNPFIGVPDPDYTGWYVEGSWFFGGHKTYDDEGNWGRPKIDNPMRWSEGSGWGGAVQLVGKYDVLDMSDIRQHFSTVTQFTAQSEFRRRPAQRHNCFPA